MWWQPFLVGLSTDSKHSHKTRHSNSNNTYNGNLFSLITETPSSLLRHRKRLSCHIIEIESGGRKRSPQSSNDGHWTTTFTETTRWKITSPPQQSSQMAADSPNHRWESLVATFASKTWRPNFKSPDSSKTARITFHKYRSRMSSTSIPRKTGTPALNNRKYASFAF